MLCFVTHGRLYPASVAGVDLGLFNAIGGRIDGVHDHLGEQLFLVQIGELVFHGVSHERFWDDVAVRLDHDIDKYRPAVAEGLSHACGDFSRRADAYGSNVVCLSDFDEIRRGIALRLGRGDVS